ncbi:MAG: sulfite exporter TauE/SafE family protein, partial [Gammaproteobacteria bacterium]
MSWFDQILLFFVSFLANIFSAFAGGGAGLIQLPALIFLGLSFSIALATHKVASVALGVGATLRHLSEESLERRFAVFILIAGVPGVLLGANIILNVPDRIAQIALGFLTMGLGLYSWFKPDLGQIHQVLHRNFNGYLLGGIVLFLIGVLNGSLTSGTGLFV